MSNLSAEVLNDIIESIRIRLREQVDNGEAAPTIDQLTEDFHGSGEETRREWVVKAVNELVIAGDIEGGSDPDRPIKASNGFSIKVKAQAAAKKFPSDKTNIELIPHRQEPGFHQLKPVWRLVIWQRQTIGGQQVASIKDVIESDKLVNVLKLTPWRVTWHAKVINEAIRKLGTATTKGSWRVQGLPGQREETELQLRVYEDSIKVKFRNGDKEDTIMEYDLRSCSWVEV